RHGPASNPDAGTTVGTPALAGGDHAGPTERGLDEDSAAGRVVQLQPGADAGLGRQLADVRAHGRRGGALRGAAHPAPPDAQPAGRPDRDPGGLTKAAAGRPYWTYWAGRRVRRTERARPMVATARAAADPAMASSWTNGLGLAVSTQTVRRATVASPAN